MIAVRLASEDLAGAHQTPAGPMVTVKDSAERDSLGDETAILCGNVATDNATVYLVDTLVMP